MAARVVAMVAMAVKLVVAALTVEVAAPLVELTALRMRMKALKVSLVGALTVGRIMRTTALKMKTGMTALVLGLVEILVLGLVMGVGVGVGVGVAGTWVAAGKVGLRVKIAVVCAAFLADMVVKVMDVEVYPMVVLAVQVVVLLVHSTSLRERA
jgi:hypothetical protein